MTQTGERERWLVDRYAGRIRDSGSLVSTWPLEGGADYRTLVQFAAHQTALDSFRRHYEQTTKLWKKQRGGAILSQLAEQLRRDLDGQTLTPRTIHALGVLPPDVNITMGRSPPSTAAEDGSRPRSPGRDAMNVARLSGELLQIAGHKVYLESTDGGATWAPVPNNRPGLDLHAFAVDPISPS